MIPDEKQFTQIYAESDGRFLPFFAALLSSALLFAACKKPSDADPRGVTKDGVTKETPASLAETEPGSLRSKTIEAVLRTERWPGWGAGEPSAGNGNATKAPQKFERSPTPGGQAPTFSGKVLGLEAGMPAEIGVISLVGNHWIVTNNYEWSSLQEDGSFEIKARRQPQKRHAIVVRSENHPWTFLRAEFEEGESARNIEIQMPPDKQVLLTVEGPDGTPAASFAVEVFNAYELRDDAGKRLRTQRFGYFNSRQGRLPLVLPMEPVALLIASPGLAPYYHVLDPREADKFKFKLFEECRITGTVTRDGKPVANERIFLVNDAAPLSATFRKTDNAGHFNVAGRVPGTHKVSVHGKVRMVTVKQGETVDVPVDITGAADPQNKP